MRASRPSASSGESRVCSDMITDTWLIGSVGSCSGLRAAHRPSEAIDRHRFEAPFGRLIDLDRGRRRKPRLAHEPARLELGQALGQHVGADPLEVGLQLGKAARAVGQLAQHQHRPALAEQIQRMGQAAGVVVAPFFLALPQFSYFF